MATTALRVGPQDIVLAPVDVPRFRYSAVMCITPEVAAQWLERNVRNRKLCDTVVIRYALDMLDGRWKENGATIVFDWDGHLLDGQHRLKACVEAKVDLISLVAFGVDPAAFAVIDGGTARTPGQIVRMAGVPNSNLRASVAKLVLVHKKNGIGKYNSTVHVYPTKTQCIEAAVSMHGIAEAVQRTQNIKVPVSKTVAGFCWFIFAEQNPTVTERFFADLASGQNLSNDNPVYHLRERLINNASSRGKFDTPYLVALFFKAWNAYKIDRPLKVLRWRYDGANAENFPSIDGN